MRTLCIALVSLAWSASAGAATYYIDSAGEVQRPCGDVSTVPCQSLAVRFNATTESLQPGDRVELLSDYTLTQSAPELMFVGAEHSGSPELPVIIDGGGYTLYANTLFDSCLFIQASNVVVEDLQCDGTATPASSDVGIRVVGAANVTLNNVSVVDATVGVRFEASRRGRIFDSTFAGIGDTAIGCSLSPAGWAADNTIFDAGEYGLVLRVCDEWTISGTQMVDTDPPSDAAAIHVLGSYGSVLSNNMIRNAVSTGARAAIVLEEADGAQFRHNAVVENETTGIHVEGGQSQGIYNNVIALNDSSTAGGTAGLFLSDTDFAWVWNNTFYNNGTNLGAQIAIDAGGGNFFGSIGENIFSGGGSGAVLAWVDQLPFDFYRNLYDDSQPTQFVGPSISYDATSWAMDDDPLFAEPLFHDPGALDFHLQSQAGRCDTPPDAVFCPRIDWARDGSDSPGLFHGGYSFYELESPPHGYQSNLGAFGGTPEASQSGTFLDEWVWTGTADTDWNNLANWMVSFGGGPVLAATDPPPGGANVLISAEAAYFPLVAQGVSLAELHVQQGAQITVLSPPGELFDVGQAVYSAGEIFVAGEFAAAQVFNTGWVVVTDGSASLFNMSNFGSLAHLGGSLDTAYFENYGTFQADTGELYLSGDLLNFGFATFDPGYAITTSGDVWIVGVASLGDLTLFGGTVYVDASRLQLETLDIQLGDLEVARDLTVRGDLNNGGSVTVPGELVMAGLGAQEISGDGTFWGSRTLYKQRFDGAGSPAGWSAGGAWEVGTPVPKTLLDCDFNGDQLLGSKPPRAPVGEGYATTSIDGAPGGLSHTLASLDLGLSTPDSVYLHYWRWLEIASPGEDVYFTLGPHAIFSTGGLSYPYSDGGWRWSRVELLGVGPADELSFILTTTPDGCELAGASIDDVEVVSLSNGIGSLRIRVGSEVSVTRGLTVFDQINVYGSLDITDQLVSLDPVLPGAIHVHSGATLVVDGNAVLRIGRGSQLRVDGELSLQEIGGARPTLTSVNDVSYELRVNGRLVADGFEIEYANSNGLHIGGTADVVTLDNGRFSGIERHPGQAFYIDFDGFEDPLTLTGLEFAHPNATPPLTPHHNVTRTCAAACPWDILLVGATGNLAGELYDLDPDESGGDDGSIIFGDACGTGQHDCDLNLELCQPAGGNGYTCVCAPGAQRDRSGNCVDIDECAVGVPDCPDTCVNTPGGYACEGCVDDSCDHLDLAPCEYAQCDRDSGACVIASSSECCVDSQDCAAGIDPATCIAAECEIAEDNVTGTCVYQQDPDCVCVDALDCSEPNPCSVPSCVDGVCQSTVQSWCCQGSDQCDDGDLNTFDECVGCTDGSQGCDGSCRYRPIGETDTPCGADPDCTFTIVRAFAGDATPAHTTVALGAVALELVLVPDQVDAVLSNVTFAAELYEDFEGTIDIVLAVDDGPDGALRRIETLAVDAPRLRDGPLTLTADDLDLPSRRETRVYILAEPNPDGSMLPPWWPGVLLLLIGLNGWRSRAARRWVWAPLLLAAGACVYSPTSADLLASGRLMIERDSDIELRAADPGERVVVRGAPISSAVIREP